MIDRRAFVGTMSLTALLAADQIAADPARGARPLSVPAGGLAVPVGDWAVDRDLVLTDDLMLMPGARIVVARGATLTLRGDFAAPARFVFPGAGRVDLNASRLLVARPEWWGAVSGDAGVDCLPALSACIAAHPSVALLPGDYHISGTLKVLVPNRLIEGTTGFADGRTTISRLVLGAATGDAMQVGADRDPGGPAAFLPGIRLRQIELARSVAVAHAGLGSDAPAGLRIQYATACQFENLTSMEHGIGFALRGVVRSFLRNCSAYRSRPAARRADDSFVGFFFDGSGDWGLAGGNASIYATECVASAGGGMALHRSIGAYLPGAFADLFLTRFETAGLADGIVAEGVLAQPARQKWGNGDLHIHLPILDGVTRSGIELADLSPYALVDIVDPYVAVAPGAFAAIQLHGGGGQVTLTGGQLIGWNDAEHGGTAIGLHVAGTSGLGVSGTKLLGFRRPVGLTGVSGFDIDVAIRNPAQRASQGAVQLAGCTRGSVRARVTGGAGVFPQGVNLDGVANQRIAIDATGIDPGCIAGGAVLVAGGRPVTQAGPFGSHLATGLVG